MARKNYTGIIGSILSVGGLIIQGGFLSVSLFRFIRESGKTGQPSNWLAQRTGNYQGALAFQLVEHRFPYLPNTLDFYCLADMAIVDFSNCNLATLPDVISRVVFLRDLNISGNKLTVFPKTLCDLTYLKLCNVSNNQLEEIPSEIEKLSSLKSFDLSNNKLKKLPPTMINLSPGMSLNISNNPLESSPFITYLKMKFEVNAGDLPLFIIKKGDPSLERQAEVIDTPVDSNTAKLAKILLDEISRHDNYLGLAAPQIGLSQRMFAYKVPKDEKDPNRIEISPSIMINPSYEPIEENQEKTELWEGCLSLPNLMGKVPRYEDIRVFFWNLRGQKFEITASGRQAHVIQHETDHLNGILYTSLLTSLDSEHFGFQSEITQHVLKR